MRYYYPKEIQGEWWVFHSPRGLCMRVPAGPLVAKVTADDWNQSLGIDQTPLGRTYTSCDHAAIEAYGLVLRPKHRWYMQHGR